MRSVRTRQFNKLFDALPPDVQSIAREAYQLFQENPWNPVLHLEQVHGKRGLYWSARDQGLKYSALAIRQGRIPGSGSGLAPTLNTTSYCNKQQRGHSQVCYVLSVFWAQTEPFGFLLCLYCKSDKVAYMMVVGWF